MKPTYKIDPEKITLADCPLDIIYESNKINGKFTFEELANFYSSVSKFNLSINLYQITIYQLRGYRNETVFILQSPHHQDIFDNIEYLYIFSIPQGLSLNDCLIPGQNFYRIDHWDRLFQVVPSILNQPKFEDTQD